jgi:hypothetical protein
VGFRGPNGHRNNELDDKLDVHRIDGSTQGHSNTLLSSRINHVLSEILSIIRKSLFGEAAAKSDCARSESVRAVRRTSTGTSKDPDCTLRWMVHSAAILHWYASLERWKRMSMET